MNIIHLHRVHRPLHLRWTMLWKELVPRVAQYTINKINHSLQNRAGGEPGGMLSILNTVPHCGHFILICSDDPAHPIEKNAKIDSVKKTRIQLGIIAYPLRKLRKT